MPAYYDNWRNEQHEVGTAVGLTAERTRFKTVLQSSRVLPALCSPNASATKPSSSPAFASASICASQRRASNSANQARNFSSSSGESFSTCWPDPLLKLAAPGFFVLVPAVDSDVWQLSKHHHGLPPTTTSVGSVKTYSTPQSLHRKSAIEIVPTTDEIWRPVTVRRAKKSRINNRVGTKKASMGFRVRRSKSRTLRVLASVCDAA